MKRFVKLFVATLFVACTVCAASAFQASAAETVNVTIPTFGIMINGVEIDNSYAKYPCIVYKDITYFPMTYNDSRALGLTADWTAENGLVISKTDSVPCDPNFEQQNDENIGGTATVAAGKITVNDKAIDNSAEEYPILLYKDITYFPLTWRFAVEEFGWNYRFTTQLGLEIALDAEDMKNPVPENAAENACGDNLTWRLNEAAATLYIEGTGDMWDFVYWDEDEQDFLPRDTPWYSIKNNIKKVVIGDSVTTIGDWAFSNCHSLTSIEIPDSVTTIGDDAFLWSYSLTSIEIPDSVTTIGDEAFYSCKSLTSIYVDSGNKNYCDIDGVLFSKDKKTIICYPAGRKNIEYVIPDGVTTIGDGAFSYCQSLTSIEIPNSVTTIGDGAFSDCDSLTSIEIPNSVTTIGYRAFYSCDSLASIEIPNSVTTIGDRAFSYCKFLTSIEIPDSVPTIGDYAFYYCYSLTSIEIPNSVTTIGDYAFSYCQSLTSIEIPNSVTTIGDRAFYSCDSLETIHFTGTKAQWDALGLDRDDISNAKVIISDTQSSGNSENAAQSSKVTYIPADPSAPGIVFGALEVEGNHVRIIVGTSSIGMTYTIRDGMFVLSLGNTTLSMDGITVKGTYTYKENPDGTFELDGIKYVKKQ